MNLSESIWAGEFIPCLGGDDKSWYPTLRSHIRTLFLIYISLSPREL